MIVDVVVIQGGGPGAHDADAVLADALRADLGDGYRVVFPRMPDEDDPDPARWIPAIRAAIADAVAPAVLVGHSLGGYLLLRALTEAAPPTAVRAVVVIAAPFPSGDPDWVFDGFELPQGFGWMLPDAPVLLAQSTDDEVVPFAHRALYERAIPGSVAIATTGGHQLEGGTAAVAAAIRALA
jgi:uncharacterized protein